MSLPMFLAEPGSLAGLGAGDLYRLTGGEGRHAAAVRRVRIGEPLDVTDGAGTVLTGRVEGVGPGAVEVRVADVRLEPAPTPALVMVQALAKGDRDERAVEAATELGVDAVVPWQAQRSVSVWSGERRERGERRWAAVAAAAAKQSRRSRVPEVRPLVRGQELVGLVHRAVGAGAVVVVLHEAATAPLTQVVLPEEGEVLVVVGPEGGLADQEVEALTGAGAAAVRLGRTVLRTSTAGPVALALLSDRLGRWAGADEAR